MTDHTICCAPKLYTNQIKDYLVSIMLVNLIMSCLINNTECIKGYIKRDRIYERPYYIFAIKTKNYTNEILCVSQLKFRFCSTAHNLAAFIFLAASFVLKKLLIDI